MPTSARLTPTQIDELLLKLLEALGCNGQCIYKWTGVEYEIQPGSSCTGIGCAQCPPTMNGLFRALVLALPAIFTDPNNVQVSCTFVELESPVLKALKDVAVQHKVGGSAKKSKLAAPPKKAPKKSAPAKKSKPAKKR
jgi:hypothetical protein